MEDWSKRSRDLLFNSGIPQYFRSGKSYKLSKVVNGDDGNLRAETPSWSRGLAHSGKGRGRKFGGGGFAPKLNIAYLSVNSACNFVQECSEDAKNQSACYISLHPPLYQLEASCGNLVSSWLNYASELYKRCHLLHKNLLILFVYLCSCGMVY